MKKTISLLLVIAMILCLYSCSGDKYERQKNTIKIENTEFCLTICTDGKAISLVHKPTGQECLQKGTDTPVFSFTQYRPYEVQNFLMYPAKSKTFYADTVYRVGDDLIVGFGLESQRATIGLKITDDYIGFTLKSIDYDAGRGRGKRTFRKRRHCNSREG